MFLCILVSHFNCCVGMIDLHLATLFCGSGYSGPWRALDFADEEVVVFLLLDPFLCLLVDFESDGLHFDKWARDFAIGPVNGGVENSEPWVFKDKGVLSQIGDVKALPFLSVSLFYE